MVPSRGQFHLPLTRTAPSRRENISRCTLSSRPVEEISPYRPVPSTTPTPTAPSRQNLSLPSCPAIQCRDSFPSRCRNRQDARTVLTVISAEKLPVRTRNDFVFVKTRGGRRESARTAPASSARLMRYMRLRGVFLQKLRGITAAPYRLFRGCSYN